MEKILVTRSSMPDIDEYIEEIKSIWNTRWLTNMGSKHQKLQEELLEYLKVQKIDLLTNGHMAIELSLQAMGIEAGEVITTPFTFASTTHAIVRNGLVPVFCDIDPITFTMDASKIEKLITKKTVAILPVHVYGNICDVEKIDSIAKEYNLKVIYDAAHAFGETYKGRGIGTFGDVSCFSFHATKVYNSIEGGAVCYEDEEFGRIMSRLKNFGIKNEEVIDGIGTNAKMNEFAAAMGICNLRHIDDEIAKRKRIVERYREKLEGVKGIQLNPNQSDVTNNYAYFPVFFDKSLYGNDRDEVQMLLKENNILTRKYFYPLTNEFDCYKERFDVNMTPIAKELSRKVLSLPLYAELDICDVDRICELIIEHKK